MSIWRNYRTAVIFKSILSLHATCELKRMCFPKEILWLVLSDSFLKNSWNFVSVVTCTSSSSVVQKMPRVRGLVMEMIGLDMPFLFVCEDPLRLTALQQSKQIYFCMLKGLGRLISSTTFCSSRCLQEPRVWEWGLSPWVCSVCARFSHRGQGEIGSAVLKAEVGILSMEEIVFTYRW